MFHFVNLWCTVFHFDIFIYCNMIANEAIFITLHNYITISLAVLIIQCIIFPLFVYDSLQVCTLRHHHSYPPNAHVLVTWFVFYFFYRSDFSRFHIRVVIQYLSFSDLPHLTQCAGVPCMLSKMGIYLPFSWLVISPYIYVPPLFYSFIWEWVFGFPYLGCCV